MALADNKQLPTDVLEAVDAHLSPGRRLQPVPHRMPQQPQRRPTTGSAGKALQLSGVNAGLPAP
jgi:hypothetical protein